MFNNQLKCFGTMDQAEAYIRQLVCDDCNRIGVTDWIIINQILAAKQHQYVIVTDMEFDDVGNIKRRGCYYVCLRTKSIAQ